MRMIISKIIAVCALAISLNSLASTECPPANTIQTKALTEAARLSGQQWYLLSDTFNHNYRSWNVMFVTELANVNNKNEALQQGRKIFQSTVITNHDPYPQNQDGMSYCYYTSPTGKNRIFTMSPVDDG